MNLTKTTAALLMLALPVLPVHAGGYIGIDRSSVTVEDESGDEIEPDGLRFRIGMRISEFFDLEAQFGRVDDSSTTAFDDFETTYMGAYLKGYLPVGRQSALFALAGVSGVEYTQDIAGQEFSDDQSGFSYGIGLETKLTQSLDLSADYMRYNTDEGLYPEASAINFGIKWYF